MKASPAVLPSRRDGHTTDDASSSRTRMFPQ
jgi:hypothetical protein